MTPREYAQRYWNLDVPIDNGNGATQWITVNVSCYRLGDATTARNNFLSALLPNLNDKNETVTVRVRTTSGAEEEKTFYPKGDIGSFVANPFYGKGTPEDVQIVLQLAARFGHIENTQQAIQAYCDEKDNKEMGKVGLDCNGFVGNYLRYGKGGKKWNEKPAKDSEKLYSTTIGTLMKNEGDLITKVEDLVFNGTYMLGKVDNAGNIVERYAPDGSIAHIMITQPLTLKAKPVYFMGRWLGNYQSFQVIESTGKKGLVESDYDIFEVDKKGVFTVWRGSKQEKMKVKIYRVRGL